MDTDFEMWYSFIMDNVFLCLGPEEKDYEEKLVDLRNRCGKGFEEKHLYAFNSQDVEILVSDIETPSLFGDVLFTIFDDVEKLNKKSAARIISAIKGSMSGNYIVFRSKETKGPADLEKLIAKDHRFIFYLMFESKKIPYVVTRFRQRGHVVSQAVAADVLSLVENDKKSIDAAIDTLLRSLEADGRTVSDGISENDVFLYLDNERDEDSLAVFSCLASKNLQNAVSCISGGDSRMFSQLFPGLLMYLRRAIAYKRNINEGAQNPWLVEIAGSAPKEIKFPSEKDFISAFCRNYSITAMQRALKLLLDGESKIREMVSPGQQSAFFSFLLAKIVRMV